MPMFTSWTKQVTHPGLEAVATHTLELAVSAVGFEGTLENLIFRYRFDDVSSSAECREASRKVIPV